MAESADGGRKGKTISRIQFGRCIGVCRHGILGDGLLWSGRVASKGAASPKLVIVGELAHGRRSLPFGNGARQSGTIVN